MKKTSYDNGRKSKFIAELRRECMTILLVEQNAKAAPTIADRGYVMEGGGIALEERAQELLADERVQCAYLGGRTGRNGRKGP